MFSLTFRDRQTKRIWNIFKHAHRCQINHAVIDNIHGVGEGKAKKCEQMNRNRYKVMKCMIAFIEAG